MIVVGSGLGLMLGSGFLPSFPGVVVLFVCQFDFLIMSVRLAGGWNGAEFLLSFSLFGRMERCGNFYCLKPVGSFCCGMRWIEWRKWAKWGARTSALFVLDSFQSMK